MKTLYNAFTVIVFALLLSACAVSGSKDVALIEGPATLLIVPTISEELRYFSLGTTIFQQWDDKSEIEGWSFNQTVSKQFKSLLTADGRFDVSINNDSAITDTLSNRETPDGSNGQYNALQASKIRELTDARYILLIEGYRTQDPFMGSLTTLSGIGFYQRSFLGIRRKVAFSLIKTTLIDTQKADVIAEAKISDYIDRPDSIWLEETDFPAKVANQRNRTIIYTLLQKHVGKIYEKMGFR